MDPRTPQVDAGGGNSIPGAPRHAAPANNPRFLTHGGNKAEVSSPKPKRSLLSYLSSSKKHSREPQPKQSKGDNSLLSPAFKSNTSESQSSLPMHVRTSSHQPDLPSSTAVDEPTSSADVSPRKARDLQNQCIFKETQETHNIPRESPLKRPIQPESIAESVEKPLQRPVNSSEEIRYSDIVATFAVDVSGSTEGKVLEEEKEAIKALCSGLSRDAFTQADIIPWNHHVQPLLRGDEVEFLSSDGGTSPSRINQSHEASMALNKCSAWFLLTDGQIDRKEIEDFSRGIRHTGLHGTPCVVVLLGYKTARPVGCNISVGLSVFSTAADCLFLFHDIDTTQVYILQVKGVFNALLPPGGHELILNSKTLWSDLPLFKYRHLFEFPLPTRQQMRPDDLLLQGRHKVNLQALYQNQIDSSIAGEILSNNDNLQSVLLAAQLRGDDDNIRKWVSEQRIRAKNILLRERPDLDSQAAISMRALIAHSNGTSQDSVISVLRRHLRIAHYKNWEAFVSNVSIEHKQRSARSTVVTDVMDRISLNRKEMDTGTNSPSILSPVTPGLGRRESVQSRHMSPRPFQGDHLPRGDYNMGDHSLSDLESNPVPYEEDDYYKEGPPSTPQFATRMMPVQYSAAAAPTSIEPKEPSKVSMSLSSTRTLRLRLTGDDAGALYIQHYKYLRRQSGDDFLGTCPICREENVLLVFLLKSPPIGISTPNFPQPNDRKGLAYPLAMGRYPETDILSSQVSCDSCAYTLVRQKIAYDGDEITAAIPIMQAAFSGEYRSTTLNLIDTALQKRFHRSSIELVFLCIIYSTFGDLDDTTFDVHSAIVKTACSWIVKETRLPPNLSMSITGSTPQSSNFGDPMPILPVLEKSIQNIREPEPPLLRYPLGGFVVLLLLVTNLTESISVNACQVTVWYRFLFHLVEKHCALLNTNQSQAVLALQNILKVFFSGDDVPDESDIEMDHGEDPNAQPISGIRSEPGKQSVQMNVSPDVSMDSPGAGRSRLMPSVRLSTLCGTHLLSEEDLEDFQRLQQLFEPVDGLCSVALGSFLNCLSQQATTLSSAMDVFDNMREREDLHDVFFVIEGE